MIVLNYHGISSELAQDRWTLALQQFDEHAEEFAPKLISPADFFERCEDPRNARSGDALLTFDDGCETDYTVALPRFAGSTGPGFLSFIVTDLVGAHGRLNWSMIREMAANGVEIGSHGESHLNLVELTRDKLRRELERSRSVLEDRLGKSVTSLAFPYGQFNRRVWRAARAVGYRTLFTTQLGHHNGFEPFLFSRLCMTREMDACFVRAYLADPDRSRGLPWRMASALGVYRAAMHARHWSFD